MQLILKTAVFNFVSHFELYKYIKVIDSNPK